MKKTLLRIIRSIRYPFYQAAAGEEEFLDEEYRMIWDEAEQQGIRFKVEDRVGIFQTMECITHIHQDGIDYFYCFDYDQYWDELASILEKKGR